MQSLRHTQPVPDMGVPDTFIARTSEMHGISSTMLRDTMSHSRTYPSSDDEIRSCVSPHGTSTIDVSARAWAFIASMGSRLQSQN